MNKLVCKKCGGDNIQTKVWVNANTNKYIGEIEGSAADNWCDDCEEHVEFKTIKDETHKI